jgi:hypothetical protein
MTAAGAIPAILVVFAFPVAAVLRAGAVFAATGALMTVVVAATFGANGAIVDLAADETVATIELRASARGGDQSTGIAEGRTALIEARESSRRFATDFVLIATAVADVVWPAYEARIALFRSAAFHAFQPAFDATCHQAALAQDDVCLADPINAGEAVGALVVLAAFIPIHAFDDKVWRWADDATELVLRAGAHAFVHARVAEFARIVTEERLADVASVTSLAETAILVRATFHACQRIVDAAGHRT